MSSDVTRIYSFGDFMLDPREHRLLRGTEEIYLAPKTFETLLYLLSRHGHLVTKNDLLDTLWSGTFVTENALTRCIKEVREALNDDAHQPLYIKTIPRVGYKFIADVKEVSGSSTVDEQGRSWHRAKMLMLVSIPALAIIGTLLLVYYFRAKQVVPERQINSIAILPFKPLASDARDESLELGMADTLITTLSNVEHLTVRPTSAVRKYTALDQDALAAGREQRVDAVLEGTIQMAEDHIRVTVRLLRVEDGAQLWADQVDQKSSDIFSIQDSIAERVAATLPLKLSGAEKQLLTKRYTANTEAYQHYLKGRYFLNKTTEEDFRKAVDYFHQAIEKDPNYALAYVGLADSYAQLGSFGLMPTNDAYARARAASMQALARDDKLGEAHASLGFILGNYYWDWPEAERQFKQAIVLNSNYAMTHTWYSQYLAFMGRSDQAIEEVKRALEIDPLSPWSNSGFVLFLGRHYDEAIQASQKALELDKNFAVAHMVAGLSYVQKKSYVEAISELQQASANPDSRALLAYAYAMSGNKNEARKILKELDELSKQKYVSPFPIAVAYTGLGDHDRAFEELEKAQAERSWAMGMLRVNPVLDPLRSDKRFTTLLQRVNLA
ncbi:MAG TPA: winged helix-turn-helix domain-containing protein [Pyrinomonadaceae bacterium]|nr:winged helix-turn-helix domain-containing protein [Pyrinomonadaceae bacterium]